MIDVDASRVSFLVGAVGAGGGGGGQDGGDACAGSADVGGDGGGPGGGEGAPDIFYGGSGGIPNGSSGSGFADVGDGAAGGAGAGANGGGGGGGGGGSQTFPGGGGAGFSLATGGAGLVAPTLTPTTDAPSLTLDYISFDSPPASLTDGAVSAPYSAQLSATYGASTQVTGSDASWTVTPALPAGLPSTRTRVRSAEPRRWWWRRRRTRSRRRGSVGVSSWRAQASRSSSR